MVNRQKNIFFPLLLILMDAFACAVALMGIYILRFHIQIIPPHGGYDPQDYIRIFPFAILIWIISFGFVHLYRPKQRIFNFEIFRRVCKGSFLAIIIIIACNFFLREAEYARILFPMALIATIITISIARAILSRTLIFLSKKNGLGAAKVLIVGTGTIARMIAEKILEHPHYGYQLAGFISYEKSEDEKDKPLPAPIIGTLDQFRDILKDNSPDQVFLTQSNFPTCKLIDLMMECEKQMVDMKIVPNIFEMLISEIGVEDIEGIPLFGLKESPLQGINLAIKRCFDIVFSIILLIFLSPFLLVIAILIKIDSRGSIFYHQRRIGMDGRTFTLCKFRTMIDKAESQTGPVWAKENDPRVTKFGRWLRKTDLDELPQLINVIKGEMSLVGPRPERPFFVDKFKEEVPRYMARHKVKSGMTGWAQANGFRGNTSLPQRIKYDLFYIENWSLWFDLNILLLTFLKQFSKFK